MPSLSGNVPFCSWEDPAMSTVPNYLIHQVKARYRCQNSHKTKIWLYILQYEFLNALEFMDLVSIL